MSENLREPEVPEGKAPAVECLDGLARITLEELAITHFVKSGTLQNACSTRPRVLVGLWKSALVHTARLLNSLAKGRKRMVTKSAVAMHFKIRSRRSLHQFCGRAQTYWSQSDVFNSLKPCYVMVASETRIHRLEWFAQVILITVPQCSKIWGLVSRRDGMARAMCPWSSVEVGKTFPKIKGETLNSILLTFGKLESACAINPWTRRKRICCRLQSADAHDQQKGFEFRWIGNRDDIEKSDDGCNSQWWSADAWRGHSSCQRIGYILDNESPQGYACSSTARKALPWKRIFLRVDQRPKTTSH